MNEQLQGAVAQILERAISGIDSSVEFMQSELPDVIEQLLLWYAVKGVIYAFVGVLFLIPMILFINAYLKQDIKGAKESSFWVDYWPSSGNALGMWASCVGFVCFFMALFGSITAFISISTPLQIWIAPKIWLMEYAAKLVN